jgi:hypothetical protein
MFVSARTKCNNELIFTNNASSHLKKFPFQTNCFNLTTNKEHELQLIINHLIVLDYSVLGTVR